VQIDNRLVARALMQLINVLGDQVFYRAASFELNQRVVCLIGQPTKLLAQ